MKTKTYQSTTYYVIPDGEGFTALPITFNHVIARAKPEAISSPNSRLLRSLQSLAMTLKR